jgi:hypothetical protein
MDRAGYELMLISNEWREATAGHWNDENRHANGGRRLVRDIFTCA